MAATIKYLTDEEARAECGEQEQWEDPDGIDHGATDASIAVRRTLGDLAGRMPEGSTLTVMRDWEGFLVAVADVNGAKALGIYGVVSLTSDGRIGEGGVNLPRYYETVADMLGAVT